MRIPAVLAAAALATAPAAAQENATPAENLDCAIWAAYVAGSIEDSEMESAFAIILSWFVGLYEGQTGSPIDEAMAARAVQLGEEDMERIGEGCLPRMAAYGDRLSLLGNRLQGLD